MTNTIWGVPRRWYRRLFYISLVLTCIFMMIAIPPSQVVGLISDKMAHFIIFFGITLLCSRGMRDRYGLTMLLWLAGFGLFTELLQWLVPWRSFSLFDWLADIAGILSYHCLYLLKAYFFRNRS